MSVLQHIKPGVRLYDRRSGQERLVQAVEDYGQVVFLSFKQPQTGAIDRQPYPAAEIESRFELLGRDGLAFRAAPEVVSLVAEAYRLRYAYLVNHRHYRD